jgi:hypothetical protein
MYLLPKNKRIYVWKHMKLEKYYLEKANLIRKFILLLHPPVHEKIIL